MHSNACFPRFCAGRSDPEPTPRSDVAKEVGEKTSEATHAGEAPGPDAQVIGALDEDKSETSSPTDGGYEVEITGASEHTSELSMEERLEKEKEETVKVIVEPRVVDLDDPLNKPLKVILPGGSKPMEGPRTPSVATPLSKKSTKGKCSGEEPSGKKLKKHKK